MVISSTFAKMKLISAIGVLVFSQISGAPHEDAIRAEIAKKQAERQAVMVRRTQEHFNDYTKKQQAENKTGCADVGFRFDTTPVQNKIRKNPSKQEKPKKTEKTEKKPKKHTKTVNN